MEPDAHWSRTEGATVVAALETGGGGPVFAVGDAAGDVYLETRAERFKLALGNEHASGVTALAAAPSGRALVAAVKGGLCVFTRAPEDACHGTWERKQLNMRINLDGAVRDLVITALAVYEEGPSLVIAYGTVCGRVGVVMRNCGDDAFCAAPAMPSFSELNPRMPVRLDLCVKTLVFVSRGALLPPVLIALATNQRLVAYTFYTYGLGVLPLNGEWTADYVPCNFSIAAIAPGGRANEFAGICERGMVQFTHTPMASLDCNVGDWPARLIKNPRGGFGWRNQGYGRGHGCDACTAAVAATTATHVLAARPDGSGGLVGAMRCGHVMCWSGRSLDSFYSPALTIPAPGAHGIACAPDGTVLCLLADGRTCGWDGVARSKAGVDAPVRWSVDDDCRQIDNLPRPYGQRGSSDEDEGGGGGGGGSEVASGDVAAPAQPAGPVHECVVCMEALADESRRLLLPCTHAKYCSNCAPKLKVCSLCRTPIQSVVRVFL